MPWFNLNKMHDNDLRAIYHFIKSLGDPGKQAPDFIRRARNRPCLTQPFPARRFPVNRQRS
jgi:hypothetical protein